MHALPECSAALSVKLGKRPDQKRERERSQHNRHEQKLTVGLKPTTTRLRACTPPTELGGLLTACLAARTFCHKQQHTLNACPPFTNLVSAKARRGFEPRLREVLGSILRAALLMQLWRFVASGGHLVAVSLGKFFTLATRTHCHACSYGHLSQHLRAHCQSSPSYAARQTHMHDKVHLHQPGIEPGSHRRRRCILPLDH